MSLPLNYKKTLLYLYDDTSFICDATLSFSFNTLTRCDDTLFFVMVLYFYVTILSLRMLFETNNPKAV